MKKMVVGLVGRRVDFWKICLACTTTEMLRCGIPTGSPAAMKIQNRPKTGVKVKIPSICFLILKDLRYCNFCREKTDRNKLLNFHIFSCCVQVIFEKAFTKNSTRFFWKMDPKIPSMFGFFAKWPNWRGRFDHRWGYCHHPPKRVIRKATTRSRVNDHHKPKPKSCMKQEVCVCASIHYMKNINIMICNARSLYIYRYIHISDHRHVCEKLGNTMSPVLKK